MLSPDLYSTLPFISQTHHDIPIHLGDAPVSNVLLSPILPVLLPVIRTCPMSYHSLIILLPAPAFPILQTSAITPSLLLLLTTPTQLLPLLQSSSAYCSDTVSCPSPYHPLTLNWPPNIIILLPPTIPYSPPDHLTPSPVFYPPDVLPSLFDILLLHLGTCCHLVPSTEPSLFTFPVCLTLLPRHVAPSEPSIHALALKSSSKGTFPHSYSGFITLVQHSKVPLAS